MIVALNKKRPHPNAAKQDHNKDAPPRKWANIVEKVSNLKTLLPPPTKTSETSGTASGADTVAAPPPVGLKHHLPEK